MFAILIVFIYVWVFLVSMLDLRAGIRKAKKQGVYRSSKKLRRTVEKLTFYYNVMLALSFADMLAVVAIALLGIPIPRIPYLSFIGAFGVGIIEIKSIIEKAEDKQKADVADALAAATRRGSAARTRRRASFTHPTTSRSSPGRGSVPRGLCPY